MKRESNRPRVLRIAGLAAALIVAVIVAMSTSRGESPPPPKADEKVPRPGIIPLPPEKPERSMEDLNARAQIAGRRVTDGANEVGKLLAEVQQHVSQMKPGDIVVEKMAIDAFRKLLPKMKAEARWLLDKRVELEANGERYVESLNSSSQAFLDLVPIWERFAQEEAEGGLRDNYIATAKNFKTLSEEMKRRRTAFEAGVSTIHEKLAFVERSHVFLDRLERALPILDQPASAGAEVQAYLTQVRKYLDSFEIAIKAFKDLSDNMQRPSGKSSP
jgi:hypothetical protein